MTRHRARKRFGQHFLVDSGIVSAIVDAVGPGREDTVVEIGPGLGALTRPLLRRLDRIHVVEIDRDIVARWRRDPEAARLTIHEGDALAFDFAAIGRDLRIVGNLPYNISTPLLFHLAAQAGSVRDLHFMLQKEVVDRMVAGPGSEDYGRLSVMLQYRFDMAWLFDVPPESFDPPPRVESAVVRMQPKPRDALPDVDEGVLQSVVTTAFGQRRKMIRNTLGALLSASDFERLELLPSLRAEDLALGDFIRIAACLQARSCR